MGGIVEKEAQDLMAGDLLEQTSFPIVDGFDSYEECEGKIVNAGVDCGKENIKFDPEIPMEAPINNSVEEKMWWFRGFVEPYVFDAYIKGKTRIVIPSAKRTLLEDVKFMLQTCGRHVLRCA